MTMTQTSNMRGFDDQDGDTLPLWPRMLFGGAVAFALVAGFGGWAYTAQLSGAVISQGVVVVEANVQTIQHRDGGVVAEIAVKEGDTVAKGQLLLRLDDAQTRSERAIVQSQIAELQVKRARLEAERDGAPRFEMAADWREAHPETTLIVAGETRLFKGQQQNRLSQKQQLDLSASQINGEIDGLRGQQAAKTSEIALVEAEYDRTNSLKQRNLIEASRLYAIEREKVRMRGELSEIQSSIARAQTRISEVKLQILAIDETASTDAQRELSQVETKLAELGEREIAIADRLSRTDLRAPIAGVVNELNIHTVGGVVTPAAVLVTLVPLNSALRVQIKLPPASIDQVKINQSARLRFPAFNQRVTPELMGTVSHVSASTAVDPATGQAYYQGFVSISPSELAKLGKEHLQPGMPAEVFVATDERTVMSYLLKPIIDRFAHALRER